MAAATVSYKIGPGPHVDSVQPATSRVLAGTPGTFTVKGSMLPVGMVFQLDGCASVSEVLDSGTATQRQFACTFPSDTPSGERTGTIGPVGSAGTPFDKVLSTFVVSVMAPTIDTQFALDDKFDGDILDPTKWTSNPYKPGYGDPTVANGLVHLANCQSAHTDGKVAISGNRIVIEARFVGPKASGSDSNVVLIDKATGSRLQIGDSTYWSGIYLLLSKNGTYDSIKSYPGTATHQFKVYRIALDGTNVTIERGDSLDTLTTKITEVMPRSVTDGTYYVQIGTGGCDGIYSPADFDWIRVYSSPS